MLVQLFAKIITPTANKFIQALKNPQATQQKVQQEIFKRLINSEYGKSLNIQSITDWHQIPIVEYHDIEKWILQQQQSKKSLLTSEAIIFSEKTSGSRGAAKLIPYTKSLRRSFNQMFCVWAHDLIVHGPKFSTGKIYFCISPQLGEGTKNPSLTQTVNPEGTKNPTLTLPVNGEGKDSSFPPFTGGPRGVSTGLQDDSEYLDEWLKWFFRPFLVSPPGLNRVCDVEEFKNKLAQALLAEENLEIISIWSPSFLQVILDYIQTNRTHLASQLGSRISPERRQLLLEPHLFSEVPRTPPFNPLPLNLRCTHKSSNDSKFLKNLTLPCWASLSLLRRGKDFSAAKSEGEVKSEMCVHRSLLNEEGGDIPWTQLWRKLKLISCWDSANAADGAGFLRSVFPNVLVQGKGLLATEAPMTIPLIAAQGSVPVLDEVFFEFQDEAGKILRLHELEKGSVYEIILSQKGGLYRYRIGDRVLVSHFYHNTPCLQFLGRTQEISDLVGEKLHSEFVRDVLNSLQLSGTFFKSLVPAKQPRSHYVLLLDRVKLHPQELAENLDAALQQSPQYRHARLLGQLGAARVLVSSRIPEIITLYKTRDGKKWGDLKHEILSTTPIAEDLLIQLEKVS